MKRRFDGRELFEEDIFDLEVCANLIRTLVIQQTTLANSGHVGGPLGRAETDAVLYHGAKIDPKDPFNPESDIIIDSAGHYSAGTYAALALRGFFPQEDLAHFRKARSRYEGHVSHKVPGVWLDTGILGQGFSAGIGFSLANKLLGNNDSFVFVKMGDGEQNKGQISEARRFAAKYHIRNVIPIIDVNDNQLTGSTKDVMPMALETSWEADGWEASHVNGHNIKDIIGAINVAKEGGLTAILASTVMGKGFSEIEGNHEYHGKPLTREQADRAFNELGTGNRLKRLDELREMPVDIRYIGRPKFEPTIEVGVPIVYNSGDKVIDCRSAWGNALVDLGRENIDVPGQSPIAVVDCDLKGSVKTARFAEKYPNNFFQSGIMEHHAASMSGAMSLMGVLTFLADFGVFSTGEMASQNRMTAINNGNLKLVSTHCGLDVGEDGKTHQVIDYLSLNNHPGWQTFCPADPNQADRIVRFMAGNYGCMHLAMGRSKIPVITKQGTEEPFFDKNYKFEPGKIDVLRDYGCEVVVCTYGSMAHRAVNVADSLNEKGLGVRVLNLSTPTQPNLNQLLKVTNRDPRKVITYEDHFIGEQGREHAGMGPILKGLILSQENYKGDVECLGVRSWGLSGRPNDLYKIQGLGEDTLAECIKDF